jgi:hypothetical protein
MKKIHQDTWADCLENGLELPVGGSFIDEKVRITLTLDYDSFHKKLGDYHSPDRIFESYKKQKEKVISFLNKHDAEIDPYLFYVAYKVQGKVESLLEVDIENPPNYGERLNKYHNNNVKLSEMIGQAMCAEQAALGQYLLQNVLKEGYSSSFVAGASLIPPEVEAHSFLVIRDLNHKTYIYDIARPLSKYSIPRIFEPDFPFTYKLLSGPDKLIMGATEIILGGRAYFGVMFADTVIEKRKEQE